MTIEQDNEHISLNERVNQELDLLTNDDAARLPLNDAYKKVEEEQERIDALADSNNEFLKYSEKSESEYAKNDKKLPGILKNINKLYYEKWIDQKYKPWFAQLIQDECSYSRKKYIERSNVVWFLQMTNDKFTDNPEIKDWSRAFSQYKDGTRSVENIANDTASQMKTIVYALENHKEYNKKTKKLEKKPVAVSFWSLKFYQYCWASKKINDQVTNAAWNSNIKHENSRLWLWLSDNPKPTWKQAIAAYDKWAGKNIV